MSSSLSPSKASTEAAPPRIVTPTHGSNSNINNSNNSNNSNNNSQSHRKPPMSPTGKPLKSSSRLLKSTSTNTNTQIKIFVLLLQPQSKIFELIQLVYNNGNTNVSHTTTTIGDLLDLIPSHATEPALGSQTYTGLCRPTTTTTSSTTTTPPQGGLTDLEARADFEMGEILVGIPHGFTAAQVASLSHAILTNPKIVKLLQRADPLGQSKRKRRHRKSSSSRSKSSSSSRRHFKSTTTTTRPSKLSTTPLPFHPEVDESQWTVEAKLESERQMKQAMAHAAAEAAAANAACSGGGAVTPRPLRRHDSLVSQDASTTSSLQELDYVDYETTTTTNSRGDNNDNSTMDDSFSSWSKSFDASFSGQSSICSSRTLRAHRRQVRAQRRMWLLQQCALVGLVMMIAMYCLDPQHHHHHHHHPNHAPGHYDLHHNYTHTMDNGKSALWHLANAQREAPLAWKGLVQVALLLLALYKWQLMSLYTRKAHQWTSRGRGRGNTKRYFPTLYMSDELHVCPFLQASGKAWKRFQSKYAQKLQRHATTATATPPPPTNVVLPSSSSRPLRSFSLKAGGNGNEHHFPQEE